MVGSVDFLRRKRIFRKGRLNFCIRGDSRILPGNSIVTISICNCLKLLLNMVKLIITSTNREKILHEDSHL